MSKNYETLKAEFLHEIDLIASLGYKIFIYPFIGKSKTNIFFYKLIYLLILVTSSQLFITLCVSRFQDWTEIVNIAPNLGVCLMILLKYSKMYTHSHVYENILHYFKFDVWDIISDTKEHKIILERCIMITRRIIRNKYYFAIAMILTIITFPRIISLYETQILHGQVQYLYPFDGWYPFDKIKWYYAVYVWESLMTTIVILIYVYVNAVHISYTLYICMELQILGNLMENIVTTEDVSNVMKREFVKETHDNIKRKLKLIIKRHQFLTGIVSDLNYVLGDGFVLTYAFSSVFIGLTIFTATVEEQDKNLEECLMTKPTQKVVDIFYMRLRYTSFFSCLLVDVFLQCIIGQLLVDHSLQLEQAIYFADWAYADQDMKRTLLLFLVRAQKPLTFTARGYVTMNLDTFSNICSFSYQLFNLLRTSFS